MYIYACLIHRMDSPVMGGTVEPYFTCNVLIPHPMIHLLLSTLPLPGLHVYTSCVVRDLRYEARGTGCEVWGICTGRGARGMRQCFGSVFIFYGSGSGSRGSGWRPIWIRIRIWIRIQGCNDQKLKKNNS